MMFGFYFSLLFNPNVATTHNLYSTSEGKQTKKKKVPFFA